MWPTGYQSGQGYHVLASSPLQRGILIELGVSWEFVVFSMFKEYFKVFDEKQCLFNK